MTDKDITSPKTLAVRDKIAEICIKYGADQNASGGVADAILATLPDMIPDLGWEKLSERLYRVMMAEKMSWRCESYNDGRWFLTWSVPGYCDTLIHGEWDTLEQAKAVANAHHKAQLSKAMGWTS